MIDARSHLYGRHICPPATHERALQTFLPERHTNLLRRRGGIIYVPVRAWKAALESRPTGHSRHRLTKLLLNVTIERSLGPVQLVMSPENSVDDLIKAAVETHVREKRRPLVKETDPRRFELHYSQFSLECFKGNEKLIMLGSRNFYLCSKQLLDPSIKQAKKEIDYPFPLIKLMDFLL